MNSIFKKIRQQIIVPNNFQKYLLYGVGEILLVVIGILIALQVNNWNQAQSEIKAEKRILEAVVESLKEDSILFEGIQQEISRIDHIHRDVYDYTNGDLPADSLGQLHYLRRTVLYNPVTMINHPDLANEIISRELKQSVRSYYQKMDDVQYIIDDFNRYVEDFLRPFMAEIQILNYGFQYQQDTPDLFIANNLIDRDAFLEEVEDSAFQQMLFEAGVKYLVTQQVLGELQAQNHQIEQEIRLYLSK